MNLFENDLLIYLTNIENSMPRHLHCFSPSFGKCSGSEPEPMEVEVTHLPPAERRRRIQLGQCLYCGQVGHQLQWCPVLQNPGSTRAEGPSRDVPSPGPGVSIQATALPVRLFLVPITVADCPSCPVSTALVDSGAAGNFMDQTLASSLNITINLLSPFPFQGLVYWPLLSGT